MNKWVWIFQQKKEITKKGADAASWYVGWYDLQGKRHSESCGSGSRGKNAAAKRLRRIQSELDTGIHEPNNRKLWTEFQTEYEEKILSGLAPKTNDAAIDSLGHFQRISKPGKVQSIKTAMIDEFISKRRLEAGLKAWLSRFSSNHQQGSPPHQSGITDRERMGLPSRGAEDSNGEGAPKATDLCHT